jgi:RHS repeat-associated protein
MKKVFSVSRPNYLLFAATVLLAVSSIAFGQERQPSRGLQFGNSYATNGIDSVNVSNGNVVVNLPVASLPAGRGTSPGFTVTLQYNSKLWDSRQLFFTDAIQPGSSSEPQPTLPTYNYSTNTLELSDRGGWKLLTGYRIIETDRLNLENPNPCLMGDPVEKLAARWKLEVEFPDGTVRQFIPTTSGTFHSGYYGMNSNGLGTTALTQAHPGNSLCYMEQYQSQVTTGGMNYISADGSRLRLFVPYHATKNLVEKNWKIYAPDGTVVENAPTDDSSVAQRISDRNNNKVEIKGNQIVDQLGRSITIDEEGVTVKGVDGEDVTTQIVYGTRWVNRPYNRTGQNIDEVIPSEYDRSAVVNTEIQTVDEVILPTQLGGQSYSFDYYGATSQQTGTNYTEGWGELKSVTLPSGAEATYTYEIPSVSSTAYASDVLENKATERSLEYTEQYDGGSTSRTEVTTYSASQTTSSLTNPDGSSSNDVKYFDTSSAAWNNGLSYKTSQSSGAKTERIWKQNMPHGFTGYEIPGGANSFVKTEFTSIADSSGSPSLTAIKDFECDKNGNVTKITEYDWVAYSSVPRTDDQPTGIPSGATVKRVTLNTYYYQAPDSESTSSSSNTYENPSSPTLKNLLKSTEVQDASTNIKSRSEFFYDDTSDTGNLTETRVWDSTKGALASPDSNGFRLTSSNYIATLAEYDTYGNVTETTDANGVQSTITYGCIDGSSSCTSTPEFAGLYPTKTEVASNYSTLKRTSTATYDFHTGVVLTTTDVDNGLTNSTEYDDLGRPTKAITADGDDLESWVVTEYHDEDRFVVTKGDLETKGDGKKVATQFFDQLGRVRLTKTLENAATQSATNETDGIKVQTRYKANATLCPWDNATGPDELCSAQLVSNPYRASTSSAASGETTMGWTVSRTQNNGRRTETETYGGTALPKPFVTSGFNTNSTGVVKTEIDANATTVTDQAGKLRRSITNGIGQLTRVDEPDNSSSIGSLGSVSSPNQPTDYSYDALGNLLTITQAGSGTGQCGPAGGSCSQTRSFTYSSLSRLLTATNPESGTYTYTYDNNGNVLTKTDARSVSTNFTYDALNRAVTKNYSDSTPDVAYTYDDSQVPFSKGKLTKIATSVSETHYSEYDEQERITESRQVTAGQTYTFGYTYNLDDDLLTQTYPSGKVVTFDYDNGGDLEQVGKQTSGGTFVYANSFAYNPRGQTEKVRLGNDKWETAQFNSLSQITQVGLGYSATDTGFWKANYEFGELQTNGNVDATKNNGNPAKQTITIPTIGAVTGFTAVQTYTYDSLDRLKSATEKIGTTQIWAQTFNFDRFGNRTFDTGNTSLQSVESTTAKVVNPEILNSNNRFKLDQDNDSQNDYLYDSSGNLTKNAQSREFTFDAENLQTTATGIGLSMNYSYDGNNKRVKSYNAVTDETTIFVYDADGDLAAEYTINVEPPATPIISYLTADALGSIRVTTNSFGEVKARRDFLPFGEELYASIGSRSANQKYSTNSDDTRKKFATYQRDTETGLDFAQSRYYSPMHGRFTSPDEFKGGPDELFDFEEDASSNPTLYADLENPQSLNKYQYSYNNPYKFNDPTGHCPPVSPCLAQVFFTPVTVPPEAIVPYVKPAIEIGKIGPLVETAVGSAIRTGAVDPILIPTNSLPSSRLFGSRPSRAEGASGTSRAMARPPNLKPVESARGPHSTARRNSNNKVTRYTTWEKNPRNPTGKFTPRKSVDTKPGGRPHRNSETKDPVPTPHTQSDAKNSRGKPRIEGGVRPARDYELPKNQ